MQIFSISVLTLILPIVSIIFLLLTFLILQNISKNKLKNIIITILSITFLNILYLINNFDFISQFNFIYVVLTSIMNIYIFINIINLPVSSIQINLLRLINNKKLTLIGVFKHYNDSKIFNLRYKRLIEANIFVSKKKKFILKNKFIIIILHIFLFLRKISNLK